MIFLFFGTSLALLEAELQHFKDWEDWEDMESVKDWRKTRFWGKNTKFLKIQKKSQDQNRSIFRLQRTKSLQNN